MDNSMDNNMDNSINNNVNNNINDNMNNSMEVINDTNTLNTSKNISKNPDKKNNYGDIEKSVKDTKNKPKHKKNFSFMKLFSRVLFIGVLFLGVAFLYLKFSIFLNNKKMDRIELQLQEQKIELSKYTQYTGYSTLLSIRALEKNKVQLPWSKHIKQIFTILQDLQDVSDGSNKTIVLSDFEVSLDNIKLNGKVTTLKALYYNSPNGNFRGLFDRFQELDFIKNLEIKKYEKNEKRYFDFVLHANVMLNDE